MRTVLFFLAVAALACAQPGRALEPQTLAAGQQERFEESGCEPASPGIAANPSPATARDVMILMVPESTGDVVGMYDPYDGTYLGDMITDNPGFSTPINAIQGPDANIYVSDQVADAVFVFDPMGTYLYTYADASDGLDNVRGIAFRDGELFVTLGSGPVARFNGPHSRMPDFINDGSDPFDIYFLPNGEALLADIAGTTDNVRLYDAAGNFQHVIFNVNFPEQIIDDPVAPGAFLNASFSANVISDFDLDGTVWSALPFSSGRGVYRLGNGNLLATNGSGTHELDAATGVIVETQHGGSGRFIEVYTQVSGAEPTEGRTMLRLGVAPSLCGGEPRIEFTLPQDGSIELGVFDASGRCVTPLLDGWARGGTHVLEWNRVCADGTAAQAGVYFVRLRSDDGLGVRRIVLAR